MKFLGFAAALVLGGCGLLESQALDQTCGFLVGPLPQLEAASDAEPKTDFQRLSALKGKAEKCGELASPKLVMEVTSALLKTVSSVSSDDAKTRFFALVLLAAYLPDSKFETVIKEQIEQPGLFYAEAHSLAAARFYGILEYRLKRIYDSVGRTTGMNRFTIAQLEEAVKLSQKLAVIYDSPYQEKFILEIADHETLWDLRPAATRDGEETLGWRKIYEDYRGTIRTEFEKNASPEDKNSKKAQELLLQLP